MRKEGMVGTRLPDTMAGDLEAIKEAELLLPVRRESHVGKSWIM
jgi:hypothetical protein